MRVRWLAVTAAAWLISASALSAAGPRVVSMNVCSDQLVLSLAELAARRDAARPSCTVVVLP